MSHSITSKRSYVLVAISFLTLTNAGTHWAGQLPPPIGSNIPRLNHPFQISDEQWDSLFVGNTPAGKRLSASELTSLVLHAEWPGAYISSRTHWHWKVGVFLLNVRKDGTVSSVEVLQGIGHPTANGDCIRAFLRWRFRPGSVKEARVPTYYTRVN
jgi:hypothetical protein